MLGVIVQKTAGALCNTFGTLTRKVRMPPFKHSLAYASGYLALGASVFPLCPLSPLLHPLHRRSLRSSKLRASTSKKLI